MAATKPNYLLVPPLYEESTAGVSWENLSDAARYQLEMVFNQDFDAAGRGKSWSDTELADWQWADQEEPGGLTWQDFETLPAQGLMWRNLEFRDKTWALWDDEDTATWRWMQEQPMSFTAYSGPGEDVPAPDQGRTWANMDSDAWQWSAQEDDGGRSWKEIALLPSVGLMWRQHDQNGHTWTDMENAYDDWGVLENQQPRSLCWGSLEGRWLTWDEMEAPGGGLTWAELEHLPPDNQTHKGCAVEIPLYMKSSMLRVRSVDGQEQAGDFLTTAMIKHLPRSLAKVKPPCLHLPDKIYEEGRAEIIWGDLYGAQGFVVERQMNGGEFAEVFRGWGDPLKMPCQVLDGIWDVACHFSSVVDIPLYAKTVAFRVKAFNTTDESQYIVSATVKTLPRSLAKYKPPCLHIPELHEGRPAEIAWGDLYGASGYILERKGSGEYEKCFDGAGRAIPHPEGCAKPAEHANGPDCKKHLACTDQVPYCEKTARYRLKGYNTTDSSQYQESADIAVIPVFYRDDSTSFAARANGKYLVQINARGVGDFENIPMTLQYPDDVLKLEELTTTGIRDVVKGRGQVEFRSARPRQTTGSWDGLLLTALFSGVKTAAAVVELS